MCAASAAVHFPSTEFQTRFFPLMTAAVTCTLGNFALFVRGLGEKRLYLNAPKVESFDIKTYEKRTSETVGTN